MLAHPGPIRKSGNCPASAWRELQACNSENSLESADPAASARCRPTPIWRIPEPPIEFLLVGTRGNAQTARNQANKCGRSSAGRAPPCQGGCREFESRRPLSYFLYKPHKPVFRFRAIGAAVARFPDTEEVTGSIPVSPTAAAPTELLFYCPIPASGHGNRTGVARGSTVPLARIRCGRTSKAAHFLGTSRPQG
jgi:hypothetical protein